jgi:hypothetical protein
MSDNCKFCGAVTIKNCRTNADYRSCWFLADIAADEKYGSVHASDCVRNNAPALPVAACDCGATLAAADAWAKDEQAKRHAVEDKLVAARSEIAKLTGDLKETEAKAKMRALALLVAEERFEQAASDAAGWHSEYKNERREKNAAEARGRAAGQWQPIETVPMGRPILLGGYSKGTWLVTSFKIEDEHWREAFDWIEDEPTHWAEFPTPPEPPALDVADLTEGGR